MLSLHKTRYRIANILIELRSTRSADELGIEQRLGPFRDAGTDEPAARIALEWQETAEPPAPRGELIYDPGTLWQMYRAGTDCYAAMTYRHGRQQTQTKAVLRANPDWDDLTLTEQRTGPGWESLLNFGAGELILRTAILFTGGLVFHSVGLDDNGRGIVLVGHSGAGKSTQAELWCHAPGVVAMNDDRVAVRVEPRGPMCYGAPWGGTADIARNHAAPLAALIVLEQAPANDIQRLTPADAAPLLAARTFLPFWDPALLQRAMANLDAVLQHVPVFRLRCRPEAAVIPLVRSVL